MMGDDISHDSSADDSESVSKRREDILHAAAIRAMLCAARGLTPSQACNVGCPTCGVIDASPARCEQCTPPLVRPFTGAAPGMLQDDSRELSRWLANTPEAMRCARDAAAVGDAASPAGWCGMCPGRTA